MTLPRVLTFALVAAFAALVLPGVGSSAAVRMTARDEPLAARSLAGAERVLPPRPAPFRFNLVGLHWRGAGDVSFRTRAAGGGWSAWRPARPEAEDAPDPGSSEAAPRRGWKLGNPHWTGPATAIQYRVSGRVARLRAHFLWSPPVRSRRLAIAATPGIISRAGWAANEKIVRAAPDVAPRLAFAVVHHTAGSSPASPAESAAIVRAIQAYHVRSNGWNDIGYNFLVDRFGQVFEGRGGGVRRNVVGAHAGGFNTGSVGVALIGDYRTTTISPEATAALVSLLAWRLDLAHVDPLSKVYWTSAGNARFPAGTRVPLFAVSGHRDTGYTTCPGDSLQGDLGAIAGEAALTGLPKLYEPVVTGSVPGPIRFTARLSEERPWTVTVADAAGNAVATGVGTGSAVDWTWDASALRPGRYSYAISAGADVLAATGWIGSAVPLALSAVSVSPAVVTPNGDGVSDLAALTFALTAPATVTVSLRDAVGAVTPVVHARPFGGGPARIDWNGTSADGMPVADGRYDLLVTATSGSEHVERSIPVVVDRALGNFRVDPDRFSPNGDGRRDLLSLSFDLAVPAQAEVRIVAGSRPVATIFAGALGGGRAAFVWDGRDGVNAVPDGRYRAVVAATTALGTRVLARPITLDTRPPGISAVTARRRAGGTLVRFRLGEPAAIRISVGRRSWTLTQRAGRVALWRKGYGRVRVVARDAAGNASRGVGARLIR